MRNVSGLGLRSGLGLGLLLGSAGLALTITLLRFLATHDGPAAHAEWAAASETGLHGPDLSRKPAVIGDFQPLAVLAPTGQLHYDFTDGFLYQGCSGLLPDPMLYHFTLRGPGSGPYEPYPPTGVGPVSALQRSWGTIKLMFR